MGLRKSFLGIIGILGFITLFAFINTLGFTDELSNNSNSTQIVVTVTPKPTRTREEKEKYLHNKYDNFKSIQAYGAEQEMDDIKNNTVEGHSFNFKINHGLKPDPPTNFKITPGNGIAMLSWDFMPRAKAYIVLLSMDGVNFRRYTHRPIQPNYINIGMLENGKKYYFGVYSIGDGGDSKKSIQSVVPEK